MMRKRAEEHAFDVARHLVEYGGYGRSRRAAIRALARRLEHRTPVRAERLLEVAMKLLDVAKDAVARDEAALWAAWDPEALQLRDTRVGARVHDLVPEFSRSAADLAVAWVFYWYYLR